MTEHTPPSRGVLPKLGSAVGAVALASAVASLTGVAPVGAQTSAPTATSIPVATVQASDVNPAKSGPQPAVGHGGTLLIVAPPVGAPQPAVVTSPVAHTAVAAVAAASPGFSFLANQGGSAVASGTISGSGGNGNRRVSVGYSQNTYRDVGIPVFGSKTIESTGISQLIELTGAASAPSSGDIKDHNQCSSVGLTGITASGSYGSGTVSVGFGVTSASTDNTVSTGTSLNYVKYYTNGFQCQSASASPALATRSNSGDMSWKGGTASPASSPSKYSW